MSPIVLVLLIGIVVFGLIAVMFFVGLYNRLIALKQEVGKAWANIDVILKQRFDELPRLVEVCNQYVDYESSMIDRIMSARERMISGKKDDRIQASKEVSAGMKGLLAVGEAYPELKANENFKQLQERISGLEESLSDRREYYNSAVTNFNTRIQQIPYVFLAGPLNYSQEPLFEVDAREKAVPELKFKKIG